MNHPNRSHRVKSPAANPTPEDIRAAREAARLIQAQAAALIHCTQKDWIKWESGERRMHPGLWELFLIKQGSPDAAKSNRLSLFRQRKINGLRAEKGRFW